MAHKKYGLRIAGFAFKALCSLVIIGVIALLAWRIIDRNVVPKEVKTITPNDKLCEAYNAHGSDLNMFYQEQTEYTREEKNYGYFANSGTVFIDEAEQLQFVLRYNNSTLEYTTQDYTRYKVTGPSGITETFSTYSEALTAAQKIDVANAQNYIEEVVPTLSRDENVYDVTITIMYDLTPEITDDNDGSVEDAVRYERHFPTGDPISFKKTLYNYRKFIFDGIKIEKDVLAVMVDVYYADDVNYDEDAYATLLLYYYEDETLEYKLTNADEKALENYQK